MVGYWPPAAASNATSDTRVRGTNPNPASGHAVHGALNTAARLLMSPSR